jgi:septation ring formation regulator EzrA
LLPWIVLARLWRVRYNQKDLPAMLRIARQAGGSAINGPNHLLRRITMAEEQKVKNVDELIKQIDDFEKTIQGLTEHVANLKKKLADNKAKYGTDISNWPKEE